MMNSGAKADLSKPSNEYHNLSDNLVESENYEIRKLIDGDIDGVLYITEINLFLVQAGGYLWKINDKGYVVDTFKNPGGIHSSGISFHDDYFIDWVYTGNKSKQKYAEVIDANEMSEAELTRYFDDAEIVEFQYIYDAGNRTLGRAYVKKNGCIVVMDISNYNDRIDATCDGGRYSTGKYESMRWSDTCLEGYTKKYQDKLIFLINRIAYAPDWEDENQAFYMQKFDKNNYHFEEGFWGWAFGNILGRTILSSLPGSRPTSYWSGMGYFQLKHQSENLYFKGFVTNKKDRVNFKNIAIYKLPEDYMPPENYKDDTVIINLVNRNNDYLPQEQNFKKYYKKDLGLYALRKKQNLSSETSSKSHNSWKPVFTGMKSRRSVWGNIDFYNNEHVSHHYLLDKAAVATEFHAIPQKLSFNWQSKKARSALKLYFADEQSIWVAFSDDNKMSFEISLNEVEMTNAFTQLDSDNQPMQLEMHMEEVDKGSVSFSIMLGNTDNSILLKQVKIVAIEPSDTDEKPSALKLEQTKLEIEFNKALSDSHLLQDFINLSQEIAEHSDYAKEYYAFEFANYTTKLLIQKVKENNRVGAKKVLNNYIDNLFPVAGKHDKTSDVASNGLVLSIISKDDALNQKIFDKLLGADFQINNADNEGLLFNLACYYAINNDKEKLLQTTKQALIKGKKSAQFLTDSDFKAYWNDEDFINVLNDRYDNPEFELNFEFSTGEKLRFDTRYFYYNGKNDDWRVSGEHSPIYELLYPKNVTLSLFVWAESYGTILVDGSIKNLSSFLQLLLASTKLSAGYEQIIPTMNEAFSFGIKRLSKEKVILYKALHTTEQPPKIYPDSYVVDHQSYTQKVQMLVDFYNAMQKDLKQHIDRYLHDPLYTQEVDGLSIAFLSKRLLHANKEQHFQIALKNVSDKPLYFVDNIHISYADFNNKTIDIRNHLESKIVDKAPLELKPNENITLQAKGNITFVNQLEPEGRIAFINQLYLNLSMRNDTFIFMSNKFYADQIEALAAGKFSHTWQGQISSDIAVFTLAETWQKDVGSKEEFDDWIEKFSPDIIE